MTMTYINFHLVQSIAIKDSYYIDVLAIMMARNTKHPAVAKNLDEELNRLGVSFQHDLGNETKSYFVTQIVAK